MPKPIHLQQTPCPAQTQFLRQSIEYDIRIDGRSNITKRKPIIKTQVLPHLIGSSYVFYQYQHFEAYTGIKLKLQKDEEELGNRETLDPSKILCIEVSTMSKNNEEENEELVKIKEILYSQFIAKLITPKSALCNFLEISGAKKHYLSLYIDVFILGSANLNSIELLTIGIQQALLTMTRNTLRPTVNQVTDQEHIDIINDEISIKDFLNENWDPINNSLEVIGILNTVNENKQSGQKIVFDMRQQQFESMDACLLVGISNQKVVYIKSVKGIVGVEGIGKVARMAISQKNIN